MSGVWCLVSGVYCILWPGNLELGAFKHEVAAWLTTLPSLMARE